jgi:TPR repeat protein
MLSFGRFLHSHYRLGEAERWWRRAAQAGDLDAAVHLARRLKTQGLHEDAAAWLRQAADRGSTRAMISLACLLEEQDRHNDAEHWFRRARTTGEAHS